MNCDEPVCMAICACGWFGTSVFMERMRHRSSAILATFGKSSEIHSPLRPCWENFHGEPSSVAGPPRPRPDSLPLSAVSFGL